MDQIELSKVIISDRRRTDLGDLEPLKKSMSLRGQYQPILLDENNNLIAGGRRCAAATELGWKTIGYTKRGKVSSLDAKIMELEENLDGIRKSMTAEEEVLALLDIHTKKQEELGAAVKGSTKGGWGLKDTAGMLGISYTKATVYVLVAERLDDWPDVREALKSFGIVEAYKCIRFHQEQEVAANLSELVEQQKKQSIEIVSKEGSKAVLAVSGKLVDKMWFNQDCLAHVKTIGDASVGLVHTDPPYAIEAGDVKRDNSIDMYKNDTKEIFMEIWRVLQKSCTVSVRMTPLLLSGALGQWKTS